jgi:hypothetical protein
MAFEYGVTVSFFSMITKSIPYLMSWHARESPVGPAPMMMTSVLSVFMSNLPTRKIRHIPRAVMGRKMYFAPPMTVEKHRFQNVSFGICNYTRLSSIFTPR